MTSSELDAVPGLGPARRNALLKHFGSVRKLRSADVDEIAALPGFGPRTASAVLTALNGAAVGESALGESAVSESAPNGEST